MPFSADGAPPGKVLKGIESYNFDGNTLYDRIINLQFQRRNGDSFTIRSDYEVTRTVDADGNEHYEFHTCKQKPSIEVSYRQVGSSTLINIQIRVANLYFTDGDEQIFNNGVNANPVEKIKINMGYRSQFRAWPQQVAYSGREALDRFYDLDDFVYRDKNALVNSGFSATVQVLDSWPESNPPDRIVYFNCVVGTASSGLTFLQRDNFVPFFNEPSNFPASCTGYMDRIFFLYITRRYVKSSVLWKFATDDDGNEDRTKILVYGYKRDGSQLAELTEEDKASIADRKDMWVECPLVEGGEDGGGILSVDDALVIGCPVTVSQRVRELGEQASSIVVANADGKGATVSKTVSTAPSVMQMETLSAQIQSIEQSVMAGLKPFIRPDCSYLICHESEDARDVFSNYDDKTMYDYASNPETLQTVVLPAIYDRTVNGTRTLRLPFIGFLSTGMYVGFSSRYLLGSLVGFYAPRIEDKWYKVVYSEVEFSTDTDKNTCTATCVDADYAPGEKEYVAPDTPEELQRSVEWKDIPVTASGTDGTLASGVTWLELSDMTFGGGDVSMWMEAGTKDFFSDVAQAFPGGKYDQKAGVELLLGKNSIEDESPQEGVGVLAGLSLPWIKAGMSVKLPVIKEV